MMNMNSFYECDTVIRLIAETQGEIYQLAYDLGYDVEEFSKEYLKSDFCKYEMDSIYSKYQTEFANECLDLVLYEFEQKNIIISKRTKDVHYSPNWIGMIYRYLFFSLKTLSYNLPEKVPFTELAEICIDLEDCTIEECVNILTDKYISL